MIYLQAILVLSIIGGALALILLVADRLLCNYGSCEIRINEEEPFQIEGGGKLLDALYDQGVFIPSACGGQGTCGFCKVRVLEGGGPTLPTELAFLNETEVAEQTRLACQVKVKNDLILKIKEEFLNVKEFTVTVKSARMVTEDTRELVLSLPEGETMDYRPGQYVQVFVPGQKETTFRAYSIASPPSRNHEIELLVRLIPNGLGSTYLHTVSEGDEVRLTGPYGEFELAPEGDVELVCVGGGCGMAPMRSLLRHLAETTPERPCRLFFGARSKADAMYMDEFEKLAGEMPNFALCYALSEPAEDDQWDGATGFIHESVRSQMDEREKRQVFLCGPPPMIEATMTVLDEKNVPPEAAFYDKF